MRMFGFQMEGLKLYTPVQYYPRDPKVFTKNAPPPPGTLVVKRLSKGLSPMVLTADATLDAVKISGQDVWDQCQIQFDSLKRLMPTTAAVVIADAVAKESKMEKSKQKKEKAKPVSKNPYKLEQQAQLMKDSKKDTNVNKMESSPVDVAQKVSDGLIDGNYKILTKEDLGDYECVGYMLARLEYRDPESGIDSTEYVAARAINVKKTEAKGYVVHYNRSTEKRLKDNITAGGQIHVEELLVSMLRTLLEQLQSFEGKSLTFKGRDFGAKPHAHGMKPKPKPLVAHSKEESKSEEPKVEVKPEHPRFKFKMRFIQLEARIRYFGEQASVCDVCQKSVNGFESQFANVLGSVRVDAEREL